MTQDEIIEMARQVGDVLTDSRGRMDFCFDNYGLEAFAKLVAEKEREACANAMAYLVMTPTLTHGALVKLSDVVNAIRSRGKE